MTLIRQCPIVMRFVEVLAAFSPSEERQAVSVDVNMYASKSCLAVYRGKVE